MSPDPVAGPLTHLPVHPLSFQVLLVLLDGKRHGYGIAKTIEEKDAGLGRIYPTNLYRRLRDMVAAGLIVENRAPDEDGNRKSMFAITKLGHQVAVEEARRLENVVVDARRYKLLTDRRGP
jgi:DNA-binding PadR family transcriptional regulator